MKFSDTQRISRIKEYTAKLLDYLAENSISE